MYFDRNENKEVIALLGAGSMGTAIIRRFAAGRKILLGDISEKNLEKVAHEFTYSGYDVEICIVDALNKESVIAFAQISDCTFSSALASLSVGTKPRASKCLIWFSLLV